MPVFRHDAPALEKQLELHVSHIREGRTDQDILYEVLLKSGYPLTTPVETVAIAGKTVHSVAGGQLLVCFGTQTDAGTDPCYCGTQTGTCGVFRRGIRWQ